jgi:hypothetical protein
MRHEAGPLHNRLPLIYILGVEKLKTFDVLSSLHFGVAQIVCVTGVGYRGLGGWPAQLRLTVAAAVRLSVQCQSGLKSGRSGQGFMWGLAVGAGSFCGGIGDGGGMVGEWIRRAVGAAGSVRGRWWGLRQ